MNGARAIPGYFAKAISSKVARFMLEHPNEKGVLDMRYDPVTRDVVMASSLSSSSRQVANDHHPIAPRDALARAAAPQ